MKATKNGRLLVALYNSADEYISKLTQEQHSKLANDKFALGWHGCKDYDHLMEKMVEDKDEISEYKKMRTNITSFAKSKVGYEKQYRDSGTEFNYSRFIDGRTCVYKKKPVYTNGTISSKLVRIFVYNGGSCGVKSSSLRYQTIATLELIKALQSQGKDVELYSCSIFDDCFCSHNKELLEVVCLKKGNEPLVLPRVVAGASPYFFRCFMVRARSNTVCNSEISKLLGEDEGSAKFDYGMGCVGSLLKGDKPRKDILACFSKLSLNTEGAIFIDHQEVRDEYDLKEFRKKHNITIF